MPTQDARALAALRLLLRTSHLAEPDELPALVDSAGRLLGGVRCVLHVADDEQVVLVPLSEAPAEAITIEGTLAGRAYVDLAQHVSTAGDGPVLWSPVLDGTDRLGALLLELAPGTALTEELLADVRDVCALVAELLVTRSQYGDAVERARRRSGLTVPAELQWRMLPPLTFVSPRVAIAGVLAPASEVAGDCFDYAVNAGTTHVAVLDAMGHGLHATLLSSVATAALRNGRRRGTGLAETVTAVDEALASQFGGDNFVTGIVGELDLETGWWSWVACGHPPAMLVRGGRVVKELDQLVGPPLGLSLLGRPPEVGRERLEPGDRLVLYTDGVVEARDADGAFFGVERLVDLITRQESSGSRSPRPCAGCTTRCCTTRRVACRTTRRRSSSSG